MILRLLTCLHFAGLLLCIAKAKTLGSIQTLAQTKILNVEIVPNNFHSVVSKKNAKISENFVKIGSTSSDKYNLIHNDVGLSSTIFGSIEKGNALKRIKKSAEEVISNADNLSAEISNNFVRTHGGVTAGRHATVVCAGEQMSPNDLLV